MIVTEIGSGLYFSANMMENFIEERSIGSYFVLLSPLKTFITLVVNSAKRVSVEKFSLRLKMVYNFEKYFKKKFFNINLEKKII